MQHLQISFTHFWGGAEIYCIRLCNLLLKEGVPVHFLCSLGSPLERELKKNNIPHTSMKVKSYFDLGAVFKIRKLIKELNVSSILMHSFKDAWLVTPSLIGMGKIKYYGIFHIIGESNKKDPIHSLVYSRFDKVITTTSLQINYLLEKNPIPKEKYQAIPLAVDTDFFKPEKRSITFRSSLIQGDELLIGCVGRISPEKGQKEFVEALSFLIKEGLPIKGLIVGKEHPDSKEYFENIKSYVRDNNLLEKIIFHDHTNDVSTYMASLDIFVMPSYKETFGIVLIEAMASKTAVVSTDAGGVPEILDSGSVGLLAKPKDSKDLARAIKDLILNPEKRATLGMMGFEKAKRVYSQEKIIGQWLKLV
jgi:L-malate glycosyltransferase